MSFLEIAIVLAFALIGLVGAIALWVGRPRYEATPFPGFYTRSVNVGGWTFRYHQSGQGPHLIMLHGIGANLYCWRWIVPLLAKHFTVTALDLPGFGQSSKPLTEAYGLDDQAKRLSVFFDALRIRHMYLVGNSMGGNIGLWYALENPDRVEGLCVIAPATSPRLVPLPLGRLAWLSYPMSRMVTRTSMRWAHSRTISRRERLENDRVEETFRTYGGKADAVRSFMLATDAIRDSRLNVRLGDLTTPTLILWGSRDRLVNRKVIDDLESALRAVESHVHVGGGHHLQEDEPEWTAEKILSFFQTRRD